MMFLVWIIGFAFTYVYVDRKSGDSVAALPSALLWPLYWAYRLVKLLTEISRSF